MTEKRILIAGLPGAGKTTFIAAFWSYIRSFPQDKAIKISTTADCEHEYLNSISDNWLSWEDFGRTINTSGVSEIIMKVTNVTSNENVKLNIPDIKGEIYRDNFDDRSWSKQFDEISTGITGLLLIINPEDPNLLPKLIMDKKSLEGAFPNTKSKSDNKSKEEIKSEKDGKGGEREKTPINWKPDDTSSQVKLVENLQFLNYYKIKERKIKLSIVISAWDVVSSALSDTPEVWLKKFAPLLYQYIVCNNDIFNVKYFGVSAQGCDYKDREKRMKELSGLDPMKRIIVIDENGNSDITKPVLWVME